MAGRNYASPSKRRKVTETEMILDVLLGDGDDSEIDELSDDEAGVCGSKQNSFLDQSSVRTFLNICSEAQMKNADETANVEHDQHFTDEHSQNYVSPVTQEDPEAEGTSMKENFGVKRSIFQAEECQLVLGNKSNVNKVKPVFKESHPVVNNNKTAIQSQEEDVALKIPSCSGKNRDIPNKISKPKSQNKRARYPTTTPGNQTKKLKQSVNKTVPKKSKRTPLVWEKKKFQCTTPAIGLTNVGNNHDSLVLTPIQYFTSYYSDEYFENTAQFTNMYSISTFGRNLNTDSVEIKKLYGMHLMISCILYPRLRMYWASDIGLKPIYEAMPRDRFFYLRNSLHVVDVNNPPPNRNKLWKVQPVLDSVKAGLDKIKRVPGNYSIDEQMIPFTGRSGLKQYVPNKPRPVGLKNFVMTTSSGVLLDFEVYQGESSNLPMKNEVGLGPSIVLRLKDSAPPLSVLYFDR